MTLPIASLYNQPDVAAGVEHRHECLFCEAEYDCLRAHYYAGSTIDSVMPGKRCCGKCQESNIRALEIIAAHRRATLYV